MTRLKSDFNKNELDKAKDFVKAQDDKNKKIKEGQKIVQEYYDKVSEGSQKVKDKIDELKQKIIDLNKELEDKTKDKNTDIAQRRLDILEREKEIQKEISDMQKSGASMSFVDSIPQSMLDTFAPGSMIGGMSVEDIQKAKDLQAELAALKAEETKNSFVLDQKTFDDLQAYKKLSKTEQILADFETTKKALEDELKIKTDALALEETQMKSLDLIKRNIETTFTAFLKSQTLERVTELDKLKAAALEAVAALKEA